MKGAAGSSLSREAVDDLLRVAHAAAGLAHAPYSHLRVGAALLTSDDQVFSGCNVENASFGLTLCAERVALVKAVSSGAREFRALAIATARDEALTPCGACRQALFEFAPALFVVSEGGSGRRVEHTLRELLPQPFSGADLERPRA